MSVCTTEPGSVWCISSWQCHHCLVEPQLPRKVPDTSRLLPCWTNTERGSWSIFSANQTPAGEGESCFRFPWTNNSHRKRDTLGLGGRAFRQIWTSSWSLTLCVLVKCHWFFVSGSSFPFFFAEGDNSEGRKNILIVWSAKPSKLSSQIWIAGK